MPLCFLKKSALRRKEADMKAVQNALERSVNYFASIGIADIIDILIVAFIIYKIISLVRKTNSYNLAKGMILFIVVFSFSDMFKLTMINYLLRKAVEIGLIALVVLFQPELRHLLERAGSKVFSSSRYDDRYSMDTAIRQTVLACTEMSAARTGALLVFERGVKLNEVIRTGTAVDAEVSAELIKNLFFIKAPLHDGALIIRDGRIAAAGCVLPLSKNINISKELGMRHRAGIGLSEQSDAVVVIVSEETGAISVAIEGMLKRHLSESMFERLLRTELLPSDPEKKQMTIKSIIVNLFRVNDDDR